MENRARLKNKKGLEVTMPRRVRELLIQCIEGKKPDDYLFTCPNGKRVKDFRGSLEKFYPPRLIAE